MVEVDETFLGKQPTVYTADGGFHKKTGTSGLKKIVALVERGGRARTVKVDNVTASDLRKVVLMNVYRDSVLQTDEAAYYRKLGREFHGHQTVNHSKYEYARGTATTNTVEGYFSIFKRGMKGVYQHCSEAHLHRYLAEFDFRYNNRAAFKISDRERADLALEGIRGKRLTYRRTSGQQQESSPTSPTIKGPYF